MTYKYIVETIKIKRELCVDQDFYQEDISDHMYAHRMLQ